jgi:hypothetical protein
VGPAKRPETNFTPRGIEKMAKKPSRERLSRVGHAVPAYDVDGVLTISIGDLWDAWHGPCSGAKRKKPVGKKKNGKR